MNMNEIVEKLMSLLRTKNLRDITNIYSISPENPSYPYIKVGIVNVHNFSTFSNDIFKAHILFERFAVPDDINFIDELGKIKDVVSESDITFDLWKILYKKFNKISLKQDKNILYGSVNFEFLLKSYDKIEHNK